MEAVRAFEKLGYNRNSQKNDAYVRLKCLGRVPLTVPIHHGNDLSRTTLRKIISISGFTVEDFKAAL
jgi:predicted RNA binding protein YcfA (HicA-like mRNA interferase family)